MLCLDYPLYGLIIIGRLHPTVLNSFSTYGLVLNLASEGQSVLSLFTVRGSCSHVALVYSLTRHGRKHQPANQDEQGDLDLDEGELISDTPPWTVDEGHDIWPDAGSIFW